MELSFLVAAVRRRPWLLALCVLIGVALVYVPTIGQEAEHRSQGLLFIAPPTQSADAGGGSGTDRYVANQVSILQSDQLAKQVADAVQEGQTAKSVRDAVRIQQTVGTDLVTVIATASSPQLSQAIADGYLTSYIEQVRARAEASVRPVLEEVTQRIDSTKDKIDVLNAEIAAAMAAAPSGVQTLGPEVVAPEQASERNALLTQLETLIDREASLQEAVRLNIGSEIVEMAGPGVALPTGPRKLLIAAGAVAGLILGVTIAVLLARASNEVLDGLHAEEVMGVPLSYALPRSKQMARSPKAALVSLPPQARPGMDQVCVQAEAAGHVGEVLTIVVTGTKRGAGTTTVALAVAGRFATRGSATVLVDLDPHRPTISRVFKIGAGASLSSLLSSARKRADAGGAIVTVGGRRVMIFGQPHGKDSSTYLRRERAAGLLQAASFYADVVVIDGGPLLESATTVQLAQLVDAVVLVVPHRHQEIEALENVTRMLATRRGELLPVMTAPVKSASRRIAVGQPPDPVPDRGAARPVVTTNGRSREAPGPAHGEEGRSPARSEAAVRRATVSAADTKAVAAVEPVDLARMIEAVDHHLGSMSTRSGSADGSTWAPPPPGPPASSDQT